MPSRAPLSHPSIARTFGSACLDARLSLDVSQRRLAARVGIGRTHIGRIERGVANPSIGLVEAIAEALGIEVQLLVRPPIVHGSRQPRDAVHARCSAYVDRRLRAADLVTAREVEVTHGRSHGWIDLLAFDRRTGTLFVIEVKTRLDDLGAIERQLGWYERSAWAVAKGLRWTPGHVRSWLLVLASEEVEAVIRAHRALFDQSFPRRAPAMLLDIDPTRAAAPAPSGRGLALIDPSNRRQRWLIRTRLDGRRSPARYKGYADAASL